MKVLAIDPGYERVGVALLEQNPRGEDLLLYSTCLTTPKTLPFQKRLLGIGKEIEKLMKRFRPGAIALEKLYFNSNQKTAMHVSEVRGMILYLAGVHDLPLFEYTPQEVKSAVTGSGRGDKKQVTAMVRRLLHIEKPIKTDDEYDAIAIGLVCLASERHPRRATP